MTTTVWEILDVGKHIYFQTSPFFFGFFVLLYYTYNFKYGKKANFSFELWECIAGGFPIGYLAISWLSYIICSVFYGKITIPAVWISYGLLSIISLIYCTKSMIKFHNIPQFKEHIMKDLFTSKLLILLIFICGSYFCSVFSSHMLSVTVDDYDESMIRWWSGGSVWADLAYHLSIIMSFLYGENSNFSLFSNHKSPIYAGGSLSYPFIPNFHSTCLIASGMTIRESMLYSSIFLSVSLTILLFCFMRRFYRGFINNYNLKLGLGNKEAFFAVFLFYLAGGVGFLSFFTYPTFDHIMNRDWIQFDQNNVEIYWFSIFCHILLPQRTAMYAYPLVVIILLLLFIAINQSHQDDPEEEKRYAKAIAQKNKDSDEIALPLKDYKIKTRYFLLAGILTGTLPLVHAHSFISIFFVTTTYALLHLQRSFRLSDRWNSSPVSKARSSPPPSPKKEKLDQSDDHPELRNRNKNKNKNENANNNNNDNNNSKAKETTAKVKGEGLFDYWIIFVIPIVILFSFQIPSYLDRLLNGDSDGNSFIKLFNPIWRNTPWTTIFYGQFRTFIRWLNHNNANWIADTQLANAANVVDLNFFLMWFRSLGLFLPFYFFAYSQLQSAQRRIYLSFLSLFVVANLIIFQPWDKDNTKVFAIWLFIGSISVVMKLSAIFSKFPTFSILYLDQNFSSLRNITKCVLGFIFRWLVVFIFISLIFSGFLMSVRENSLHNWEYMNTYDFELGEYVKRNTGPNDIFLIPKHSHIHPVTNLAGRTVIFGYEGWIHSHGYKKMYERSNDLNHLLSAPNVHWALFDTYNISYVVFSQEMARSFPNANEKWFKDNTPLVFENYDYRVYDTRPKIRRIIKLRNEGGN